MEINCKDIDMDAHFFEARDMLLRGQKGIIDEKIRLLKSNELFGAVRTSVKLCSYFISDSVLTQLEKDGYTFLWNGYPIITNAHLFGIHQDLVRVTKRSVADMFGIFPKCLKNDYPLALAASEIRQIGDHYYGLAHSPSFSADSLVIYSWELGVGSWELGIRY